MWKSCSRTGQPLIRNWCKSRFVYIAPELIAVKLSFTYLATQRTYIYIYIYICKTFAFYLALAINWIFYCKQTRQCYLCTVLLCVIVTDGSSVRLVCRYTNQCTHLVHEQSFTRLIQAEIKSQLVACLQRYGAPSLDNIWLLMLCHCLLRESQLLL